MSHFNKLNCFQFKLCIKETTNKRTEDKKNEEKPSLKFLAAFFCYAPQLAVVITFYAGIFVLGKFDLKRPF